jgi:hypothetical protein
MSHSQRTAKRKGRRKAVTVLGVAGALSLVGGASGAAVGPPSDTLTANTTVTLYEEEITDVSLSTFYVFDHENAGARRPGLRLAQRTRSRPRQGCGGCAVDDCAAGGPTCCATCATGGQVADNPVLLNMSSGACSVLPHDEARRIAANIAKLSELLR